MLCEANITIVHQSIKHWSNGSCQQRPYAEELRRHRLPSPQQTQNHVYARQKSTRLLLARQFICLRLTTRNQRYRSKSLVLGASANESCNTDFVYCRRYVVRVCSPTVLSTTLDTASLTGLIAAPSFGSISSKVTSSSSMPQVWERKELVGFILGQHQVTLEVGLEKTQGGHATDTARDITGMQETCGFANIEYWD